MARRAGTLRGALPTFPHPSLAAASSPGKIAARRFARRVGPRSARFHAARDAGSRRDARTAAAHVQDAHVVHAAAGQLPQQAPHLQHPPAEARAAQGVAAHLARAAAARRRARARARVAAARVREPEPRQTLARASARLRVPAPRPARGRQFRGAHEVHEIARGLARLQHRRPWPPARLRVRVHARGRVRWPRCRSLLLSAVVPVVAAAPRGAILGMLWLVRWKRK